MSLFGNRLKHVNCRTWDTTVDNFTFPELVGSAQDNPLLARPDTGVCFSGGGTRSAACTLGQLRGLHALNLIGRSRYISCVSGGAWAAVPFAYLPGSFNDESFLGMVMPPQDLSEGHLHDLDHNSFLYTVADASIIDNFLSNSARLAGDETYARALGDIFLNRFGIDSLSRLFNYDNASLSDTLTRNSQARNSDFYTVRAGRPYLIAGGTLLRAGNKPPLPDKIQIEMTPLYTGVYPLHTGAGSRGQNIGGGYIESFAFDSDAPERALTNGTASVRLGMRRHRFTLSDVIGTSGAAPAETLDDIGLDWLGFPEFKYWPVKKAAGRSLQAREYEFGDGGHLENLGIMPLLLRKVTRIIAFVNTKHPLNSPDDMNGSMPPLFGFGFAQNQVFQRDQFAPLVHALLAKKAAGETLIHRHKLSVQANPFYGIEGGWDVELLWIYNDRVRNWEKLLPANIKDMIGRGSLGNFPHYKTFFQNPPAIIDLSAKQASLAAHLACWNVTANADEFLAMF